MTGSLILVTILLTIGIWELGQLVVRWWYHHRYVEASYPPTGLSYWRICTDCNMPPERPKDVQEPTG